MKYTTLENAQYALDLSMTKSLVSGDDVKISYDTAVVITREITGLVHDLRSAYDTIAHLEDELERIKG